MESEKEKQEISLIGRIFSLDALLILMGLLSLASGVMRGDWVRISLGIAILAGGYLIMTLLRKRSRGNADAGKGSG